MNSRTIEVALFCGVLQLSCVFAGTKVRVGADKILSERFDLIKGKRIGLITNQSAVLSTGQLLADTLARKDETRLAVLFAPEHGIRGSQPAGESVGESVDPVSRARVYSLYGKTQKPTPAMLKDVDVLIFDVQDIGTRFYTYESTLAYAMEAAAEKGIPFIVLDRPNPIRGVLVEGFVRLDSLRSFVGLNPTPILHGMTVGELAMMINEEGWLNNRIRAKLTVVRVEGWKRDQWFDETGLPWVKPSPNIPTLRTAAVYPGTCLIEGTNLSEGRGTQHPFEYLGAPFIDGAALADALNRQRMAGVRFEGVKFTPQAIPGVASNPKFQGIACGGIFVNVTDRNLYDPVETVVSILATTRSLYKEEFRWNAGWIDRLAGSPALRQDIDAGVPTTDVITRWAAECGKFKAIRSRYLLY